MNNEKRAFVYPKSDVTPMVGDEVRFVDELDILTVEDVIDSKKKQQEYGFDKDDFGIMLQGGKYGRVFARIDDQELEFVSRKK